MAYFNGKKNFLVSVCTKGGSGIIEVDHLPTNNIDKNAFYLCNGKYYKWVYRSTFLLEQELRHLENSYGYYDTVVNCSGYIYNEESNHNDEFTSLRFWEGSNGRPYRVELERSGWRDDLYFNNTYPTSYQHQTITFTEPITNEAFIAWLDENARNTNIEQGWYVYCDATGADAVRSQVVKGAKFVGKNGVVEEGTMPIYDCYETVADIFDTGDEFVHVTSYLKETSVVEDEFFSKIPLSEFGNAQPSDVRKGVTFTSEAGVTEEGTYEADGEIEEVSELPNKRINRNKVYLNNGKYYKYNETNVWVFKDELGANGAEELMGKDYKFEYSVNVPNVGKVTMNEMVFRFDGTHLCISYYGDEYSIDDVYDEQSGWRDESLKTIEIHEIPDDEAFTNWLFEVAMSVGSWTEYADTTSDAPTTSETWVFNEELTNIDKPFENGYEDVACSGYMLYDKVDEPFNFRFTSIRFEVDRENGSTLSVSLRNSDTNGIGIYYIDNFTYNFRHGTITFTELPDDEVFLAWLKANATKQASESTGGGIIEVDAIPTENIAENAVYKVNGYVNINCYIRPYDGGWGESYYHDLYATVSGANPNGKLNYFVVNELPANPDVSDVATFSQVNVYIHNDIPMVYCDVGYGNMWIGVADLFGMLLGLPLPNRGFTYDIRNENQTGVYVTYVENPYVLNFSPAFVKCGDSNNFRNATRALADFVSGNGFGEKISAEELQGITGIREYAFYGIGTIKEVELPQSVKRIFSSAFAGCSLTYIKIPDTVTEIGILAFSGCSNLQTIDYGGTKAQWKAIDKNSSWDSLADSYTVYCTDGTIAKDGTET